MRKTRKEEQRDERIAKLMLMGATIGLAGSIINLITALVD